ncbi:leucyl aminopeptidase [Microlunatus elymi]|uniref:Probable cytosol aminopeptidase n=1 Tax=Microlunatus elymi TaxID=2596828 RepID=A0A516Q2L8_9ACTN|nr:leucyl aminopeptidase [Microlunatus elymi]QDP97680.1 leucyl aminopeptidase [Microlunatus elymi]
MPAPRLPELTLSRSLPRTAEVLIVGFAADTVVGLPDTVANALRKTYGAGPDEVAATFGATSKPLSTTVIPGAGKVTLVLVGLGDRPVDELPAGELRSAAGAAARVASGLKHLTEGRLAISLDRSEARTVQAVAEGLLLGAYSFQPITTGDPADPKINEVSVISRSTGKAQLAALEAAAIVARAVIANREWVNQPANLLYPESFAEEARRHIGSRSKINIEILDEKSLEKGGYGGILAVGGGSERPPRLVRLSYAPRGAKVHLGLVGKGITFDSGGLDLKTQAGMYTMKSDMSGAGAVFAAVRAIADLGLKIKITAYGSLAENMPSGSAYRPSDVLTIYGGKTVENVNTDAEGRLVMADALARLSGEDKPDLIIDVATLTGACIVALGERTVGVLSNDEDTATAVLEAAQAAGERFWRLPIVDECRGFLDSEVADLKSGRSGPGGAMTAAAFLREFVGETPWVHLDIAGPSFNDGKPYGYIPSGGTGVGVRTLIDLAQQYAG